jgi:hypothetical protein
MPSPDTRQVEVFKAVLSLGVGLILGALGLLVGGYLTRRWDRLQRQREADLAAAKIFYGLYGEFFAIWKLWNKLESTAPEERRWDLHNRAAVAEGNVEALIVQIASERTLTETQIETLGMFRQAYQSLRETIRENKKLDWGSSEHPQYQEFKKRAIETVAILADLKPKNSEQLLRITANEPFEERFADLAPRT